MAGVNSITDDAITGRDSYFWASLFEQEQLALKLELLLHSEATYKLPHFGNVKLTVVRATIPGDGFLSDSFALTANVDSGDTYSAFVKILPSNPFMRAPAITQGVFNREEAIYRHLHAELRKLRTEAGISIEDVPLNVPKLYYSNVHQALKEGEMGAHVDYNAVLVMENLKVQGFALVDKRVGCNVKEAQATLNTLANFHALGIAQLRQWKKSDGIVLPNWFACIQENEFDDIMPAMMEMCVPIFVQVLKQLGHVEAGHWLEMEAKNVWQVMKPKDLDPSSHLATFIHGDCWTNNMMYRTDQDGNVQMRLIDWQITKLGHAVTDCLHFIFTSTTTDLRVKHFSQLMENYFITLHRALDKLGIRLDREGYRLKEFHQDIRKRLLYGLFCALLILPNHLDQGMVDDFTSFNQEDVTRLASDSSQDSNFLSELGKKWTSTFSTEKVVANKELSHRIVQTVLEVKTALQD